jgi:hypothetical protein
MQFWELEVRQPRINGEGCDREWPCCREGQGFVRMTWRLSAAALTFVVMALPLVAECQPAGRPVRIGVLCLISCEGVGVDAFRGALRNVGYVEGRTLVFEYREERPRVALTQTRIGGRRRWPF